MNVNGIGAAGYPTWQGAKKAENNAKGDFGAKVKATGNVVHITQDALFSIYDAKTGESANVYRADDYSEGNPLYIVKGSWRQLLWIGINNKPRKIMVQ